MKDDYIVGYYPFGKGTDQYMSIVAEESDNSGYKVIDLMTAVKSPKVYRKIKVVNLNWFESINANSDIKIFYNYIKRSLMLSFFRITRKKIVYTFHNIHPHNMKKFKWADKLIKRLCNCSSKIVVLCDYSREILKKYISEDKLSKKMVVIPPANYKGCYSERNKDFRIQWNIPNDACVMGYVGSVQPYKNIELIIEAAKKYSDIYFVIAGAVRDEQYKNKLLNQAAECKNIITMLRFINDDELFAFVTNCDYIITPYDKKSSLNSGVAILAFTYGRTVICPIIGTLLQMGNLDNVIAYDYTDEKEHQNNLNAAIQRAYNLYLNEPLKLKEMDSWVENYILTKNSRPYIRECYKNLYDSLLME